MLLLMNYNLENKTQKEIAEVNNLLTLDQHINYVILGILSTSLTSASHWLKVFMGIVNNWSFKII